MVHNSVLHRNTMASLHLSYCWTLKTQKSPFGSSTTESHNLKGWGSTSSACWLLKSFWRKKKKYVDPCVRCQSAQCGKIPTSAHQALTRQQGTIPCKWPPSVACVVKSLSQFPGNVQLTSLECARSDGAKSNFSICFAGHYRWKLRTF